MKSPAEEKHTSTYHRLRNAFAVAKQRDLSVDWSKYTNLEAATLGLAGVAAAAPFSTYFGYPFMSLNTLANEMKWPARSLRTLAACEQAEAILSSQITPVRHSLKLIFHDYAPAFVMLMRGARKVSLNGPLNKAGFMGPPVVIDELTKGTSYESYSFALGLGASSGVQAMANFHARKYHLYEQSGIDIKDPFRYFWRTNFSPRCLAVQVVYFVWTSGWTLGGMKAGEAYWKERQPQYYDVLGSFTTLPFVAAVASPANVLATNLMSPEGEKRTVAEVARQIPWRRLFLSARGLAPMATYGLWKLCENGSLRVIALRTKSFFAHSYDAYRVEELPLDEPPQQESSNVP